MFNRENPTVVRDVAIIIWGIGILVAALVGFAAVLAMVSTEPNWAEITLAISTIVMTLATAGLAVAAVFALGSINETRHARNAETTMDISRRWAHADFREVRRKVEHYATVGPENLAYPDGGGPVGLKESMQKLRTTNDPAYRELRTEPDYFEDLAILIDHQAITFPIVNECFGYSIPYRWSLWKPTVDALRERANEPAIYIEFEKLAKRLAAINPNSVEVDAAGEIVWRGFID
jgi:hypothetical protein